MSEREELQAIEAKIDAAEATLKAALAIYREARRHFHEVTEPLYQARETLLCNADEWPDGDGREDPPVSTARPMDLADLQRSYRGPTSH